MYLNLLFKSLKLDKNTARVKAFVKRFLQALLTGPGFEPSFICGGLFLLGEVGKRFSITHILTCCASYLTSPLVCVRRFPRLQVPRQRHTIQGSENQSTVEQKTPASGNW